MHPETGNLSSQTMEDMDLTYNTIRSFSLPKEEDPLNIGINRAIDILSQPKKEGVLTNLMQ